MCGDLGEDVGDRSQNTGGAGGERVGAATTDVEVGECVGGWMDEVVAKQRLLSTNERHKKRRVNERKSVTILFI
jgi:hypothetical protein